MKKTKTKNKQTTAKKKKHNKKINAKGYICIFMFDMINNHNQYLWNSLYYFQIEIWKYWSAGFYVTT